MKSLRFSHIYVENDISEHAGTRRLLARFPDAKVIRIDHYKNVFNRRGQDAARQHEAQALILARKEPPYLYRGAQVCQSFGNENFCYCSLMRGCIYDCGYCYLKGMYPGGHMVLFVNTEDYFEELEEALRERDIYLCISYDSDLLAVEPLTGYVAEWARFAGERTGLTLEVRTKCARSAMWDELPEGSNVIYAFTLSPQTVIGRNERGTPPVRARLACALEGLERGFPVRFCFDPMLYTPGWREAYGNLLVELDEAFGRAGRSMRELVDVSVGCFRISQEYLGKLRRVEPLSAAVQYPFVNQGGVYQYPAGLQEEMEGYLAAELEKRVGAGKIFRDRAGLV